MSDAVIPDNNVEISDGDSNISIAGLTCADGKVMIQIIDRLASSGKITGQELLPVGIVRSKIMNAIKKALTDGQ